jgi:hypothetical protein
MKMTINIHLKRSFRVWIAVRLIKLAGLICGMEIAIESPADYLEENLPRI